MKSPIVFLVLIFICGSAFSQKKEEKKVRQAFENYKSAILKGDGESAVNWVDENTIEYYGTMLDQCLNADSSQVQNHNILDKMMILTLRHRVKPEDLRDFDPEGLFVHAVNEEMIGKGSVMNADIGDVSVEDDFATGVFVSAGIATPLSFEFIKDGKDWKVDLTSIMPISRMAFEQVVADSGQSEDDLIISVLTMLTGEEPGNEIWHPAPN